MTEQKANDAEIIADFRRTYEQLAKAPIEGDHTTWSMRLTLEEMRALLAAVDERDELRRQGVGDFEVGFTPVRVINSKGGEILPGGIHTLPVGFRPTQPFPIGTFGQKPPVEITVIADPIREISLDETFESTRETTIPDLPPVPLPPLTEFVGTHAVMCGGLGECFVPWCRCDCHLGRYGVNVITPA